MEEKCKSPKLLDGQLCHMGHLTLVYHYILSWTFVHCLIKTVALHMIDLLFRLTTIGYSHSSLLEYKNNNKHNSTVTKTTQRVQKQ